MTSRDGTSKLQRIYDDLRERTEALDRIHGERLHCRAGCSSCCVDGITVFEIEAENIHRHNAALLSGGVPHPEGACAFLNEEGGCRIYGHRPYVCRTQGYPLRWLDEAPGGDTVEFRDICPLNEAGPPVVELPEDSCWTIGPFEERLARMQLEAEGGAAGRGAPDRVSLRSLFRGERERLDNPWLSIPASDYEGHMGSPAVGQLRFLGDTFGRLVAECRPRSLLVLGCATGNGFDRIDPAVTERVIGVDINPEFLESCRRRFGRSIPGLELHCADAASCELGFASFDLVSAALFFEYVDPAAVLGKISRWLAPGGVLGVVLQLPSATCGTVSDTPYASLRILEPFMRLVDPGDFASEAAHHGLREDECDIVTLPSGKQFHVGRFRSARGGREQE